MMNKKAIAAFAAGATLLAGFAMATPAFAAVPRIPDAAVAETDSPIVKALKHDLAAAYDAADTAEGTLTTKKAAVPADVVDYNADGSLKILDGVNYEFDKDGKLAVKTGKTDAKNAVTPVNDYITALAAYNTKLGEVKTAEKNLKDATKPADPTKVQAQAAFASAKIELTAADKALNEAFAKADADYVASKQADQAQADAEKALNDYTRNHENEALPTYNAEVARLTKERDLAVEAAKKAAAKFTKSNDEYKKAKTKFKAAHEDYARKYAAADKAGVDLSGELTPAACDHDFDHEYVYGQNFVPSTGYGVPGQPGKPAQPGKPGAKPGQAAGQAGANGSAAAGAKTEVENKNGKDKRGNTHTGTGVGVTLTALAATMLAGMGAAVRKARH